MGRRSIELVKVLVDQIHQGGYQHRVLEDSIYAETQKRIAAEKDRDHWKAARETAIQGGELLLKSNQTFQDEIADLRQQLADAQQQRVDTYDDYEGQIAAAEARICPEANGETTIEGMADEILILRQQLDAARADNVEIRRRLNDETDRHRATNAEKVELFQQKEWANQHNAELVKERDAALATVDLQRAGIELLNACIGKVRHAQDNYQWPASWNEITAALAALDAEPTTATEPVPCPECERWKRAKRIDSEIFASKVKEIERLLAFVGKVRHADRYLEVLQALAELDAGTTEPTPATEAEDGQ